MDREKVAPALGKIPSGLFIATGSLDARPVGMLCSFVEQCGFHPPMISIALSEDRLLVRALEENGKLGLNILGDGSNSLMAPFASGTNTDPFSGIERKPNAHGIPQLTEAMAFLACEIRGKLPSGDHVLYVAEVIDGELQEELGEPMIRVRKSGFQY